MKRIPISNKNWRRLRKIRDEQGFKDYNKTLEYLTEQVFSPDKNKTMIAVDSEIFDRLVEIKADNHYATISETIHLMIEEILNYQEREEQGGHQS